MSTRGEQGHKSAQKQIKPQRKGMCFLFLYQISFVVKLCFKVHFVNMKFLKISICLAIVCAKTHSIEYRTDTVEQVVWLHWLNYHLFFPFPFECWIVCNHPSHEFSFGLLQSTTNRKRTLIKRSNFLDGLTLRH